MLNRKFLIKLHLVMAAIVLSVSAMFFITGGLYTFDYKPGSYSQEHRFQLSEPMQLQFKPMKTLAEEKLSELGLNNPLGKAKFRHDKKRHSYKLKWYGSNHSIILRPSSINSSVAVLTIKTPSWYNRFMRLHKGKGGDLFNIFSMITSVALLLIMLSGVMIGLLIPTFRKLTIYSLSGGLLLFASTVIYAQFY